MSLSRERHGGLLQSNRRLGVLLAVVAALLYAAIALRWTGGF